jgi:hypothetical protein
VWRRRPKSGRGKGSSTIRNLAFPGSLDVPTLSDLPRANTPRPPPPARRRRDQEQRPPPRPRPRRPRPDAGPRRCRSRGPRLCPYQDRNREPGTVTSTVTTPPPEAEPRGRPTARDRAGGRSRPPGPRIDRALNQKAFPPSLIRVFNHSCSRGPFPSPNP